MSMRLVNRAVDAADDMFDSHIARILSMLALVTYILRVMQ